MDDIATRSAEIELYSDLVKIGVPALTGLLGGLIGGLIPYFLEKRKLREAERRETREYWRKQVGELIDCLSDFSGTLFAYISMLRSSSFSGGEEFDSQLSKAAMQMLEREIRLKKARAIAGMMGRVSVVNAIDDFDKQATESIGILVRGVRDTAEPTVELLKEKERALLLSLNELLKVRK